MGCLSVSKSTDKRLITATSPLPVSLVGQDRWLSPTRPGFNSRTGKTQFLLCAFIHFCSLRRPDIHDPGPKRASRAPLAERSAVNRQVLGSIPSGGGSRFGVPRLFFLFPTEQFFPFFFFFQTPWYADLRMSRAHGATAARRIPDPKVGGSNPSGLTHAFFFLLFGGFAHQPHAHAHS